MGAHVRFKYTDREKRRPNKEEVSAICFAKFKTPIAAFFDTPDGFRAVFRSDGDAERLFTSEAKKELDKVNLTIIAPPEMKAKRTLVIKRLESFIGSKEKDEIKKEIEEQNNWMKIKEVIKIKDYTHIMKIVCEEAAMADRALQEGLLMFNMVATRFQIEREIFVPLLTCYNCYKYEEHTSKDCPDKEKKMCSECGKEGHTFRECKSQEKVCINCTRQEKDNKHRTLAASCPVKKQAIKEKLQKEKVEEEQKANTTYAKIVKETTSQLAQAKQAEKTHIHLKNDTQVQIVICILHAHIKNLGTPGTYADELNDMLKANGLPQMKFPENPNSQAVLGASIAPNPEGPVEKEEEDKNSEDDDEENESTEEEDEEIPVAPKKYPANMFGLTVYTTNKSTYPTQKPNPEQIAKNIVRGHLKYQYDVTKADEETIHDIILSGNITYQVEDFKLLDERKFKRVTNGPYSNTPISRHDKTHK